MGLTDRAVNSLRAIVGNDRAERDKAESPSADAQRYAPSSTYAIWGREDIGGLLSVSQNLMDRYADYEAMNDYPDIRCFSGEMKVYVVGEDGIVTPTRIDKLAIDGAGREILAFDRNKKRIVRVTAENPRLSGRNAVVMKIKLSNGAELRVTPEHKILTVEGGYVEAKDLRKGAFLVGARNGFELESKSLLTVASPGGVWVSEDPIPDGVENVYDVTTTTHNLLVNGVICHNSAFHYFANDATQPNLDNGRVVWIQSPDEALVDAADTLIKRRLRLEDDLFSIAYNLCQYGNDFEEVLVTDNGVVGLNALATPTMRRIEKMNGSLIGFVQDVTGRFTSNQNELRKMLAGSLEIPKHVALFEDWQTLHFRLRSTSRRSPYGVSVAEGARWIWKRLVMLEDSVMIYKLCLRGDSQIWTPEGRKAIKDLQEGDEVYSYTTDRKLKKTKVCYKKHNGKDKIYRVYSDHRELFANKTHPVLVETIIGQGSGNPKIRRLDYVEVQNLKPGVHRLVTPKKNEDDWKEISLEKPELHSKARLTDPSAVTRRVSYPNIAKNIGVHHYRARDFFAGERELKADTAVALLEANGYGPEHLEVEEHWGGERGIAVKGITVPEVVDEDFARWWGFMLGDGFVTTRNHKQRPGHTKSHVAQNEVGFALGSDDCINDYYRRLFEAYAPVKLVNDSGHRLGSYSVVSSKFAEFMLLNGFVPGAHNKRLPDWIFRAHPKIKLAMIRGFADADAHIKPQAISETRGRVRHEVARFEMCNKELLEDFRELAMQLGLTVTLIRERTRDGGRTIKGSTQPLPEITSYCMDISYKPQAETEMLRGVEEIDTDDIWDIGVEADEHNFVANGITVHNTRAPARYAFYVDVTDVPSNRVESFLKRAKRDLKKKKMVNPNNNFLDMRYNPLCLSGETRIPLLDGSEKTLLEMVEAHERGEEQWVHSVDVNDGNKLVPGKVVWAGGTRKNAQLVKITLDNGESIKVTPDHKMIRRSGEFAEAQTLKVGDSLMPYYRKRGNVSPAAPDYEMVYDPSDRTYKFVHRVVAEALGIKTGAPDCVIHHEDCNRLNNDPRNLTEMTWADHKALHHKLSRAAAEKLIAYNQTDKARAETAATNREYDKPALMREAITPEIREKQKRAARKSKKEFWKDKEKAAQASQKMRYVYPDAFVDAIRQIIDENPQAGAPTISRIANERNLIDLMIDANPDKAGKLKKVHRDMIRWMCRSLDFKNLKEFKTAVHAIPHNHKVVSVEWLDEREDTYTLTVDTAHTFAVSAGVFVKNSNDEDFFIAVREGRALSRVEVLSGPDYQNTDDVQYFQRKLHGALMVPRAYLGQDEPVQGRAILSNEDVRAARVTLQVQRELKNGIEQLVRTDFAARGFPNPWGLEFEVMMTVPSNIYELAAMEVKNARADFASRVQPYVSLNWIRENVFKLSEEHIAKIEEERKKEASRADRMGMDPIFGAFTGGKPPKPEDQGALGQLPQEALPPDQGGIVPEQPAAGAPQVAWREYDRRMRLEEMRDRKSRQNHNQLVDTMGKMMESNSQLARRLRESQQFMKEFTHAAMHNVGGRLVSVPSGNGRRFPTSLK